MAHGIKIQRIKLSSEECSRLKEFRKSHGFSRAEIAKILGISGEQLGHYENNNCSIPLLLLKKLEKIYGSR